MATTTVTVMFTDLVDSTALMSRVGETAAEVLRREHFSILRAAVEQRGGREVKNLGDGLMVVFATAADAVNAAVDIQRALGRRNRRAEPLVVRVGIALGDADADDGDYFGVPVVQASRLCAKAAGGEVLCTDFVRLLAGSRVEASFEPVGELDLKGLTEPVPASRVTWVAADADSSAALPARLTAAITDRFVGRSLEQERIITAWTRSLGESQCRAVLLSGEPGIGKTTLTARIAASVQADGGVVAYGRCDQDLGIPYQPWIEAITQIVAVASDDVLMAHTTDRGAHLARLVPALARRTGVTASGSEGGDSEWFVLLGCVVDLLERASNETPVLIVVDDLHWADRQTVQLLRHVATSAVRSPVLVIGTFRDTDVADGDPMSDLLAAMHRVDTVERIHLRGLDDSDLLELLERTAGRQMGDTGIALRDAVLAETDGNPFFVNEILRHLSETGAIYQDATGDWVGAQDIRTVGLPISVTEVIGRRVASLGTDTQQLLALASIIGRDFDVTTLAAASGVDELDVIDRCDRAVTAAILQHTSTVDRYTFTHALIERTMYTTLSPARRARGHRAIAETLEGLQGADPARAAELAHHWSEGAVQPTDVTKARRYAQLAGDRALAQSAPGEAVRWYSQALALGAREADFDRRSQAELLLALGGAQRQTGLAEYRDTLLEAALLADEVDDVDLLARAAIANSKGYASTMFQIDGDRVRVLRLALSRLGSADRPERALLLGLLALELHYDDDVVERQRLAREAIAVARATGDQRVLARTLHSAAWAVRGPDSDEQCTEWITEAADLVNEVRDPAAAYHTLNFAAETVGLERADLVRFRDYRHRADRIADRFPDADVRHISLFQRVAPSILAGNLSEALELAKDALRFGLDHGQVDAGTVFGAQLAAISSHAGTLHEMVPLIDDALRRDPSVTPYRATLAHAHARGGDESGARALLDAAVSNRFTTLRDVTWTTTLANWADTAVLLGDRSAAATIYGQLTPFHRRITSAAVNVLPAVSYYLGRLAHCLGRFDEASRWLDEADELHRNLASPLLQAYSDLARARLDIDRPTRSGEAAPHLAERVLELSTARGYRYLASDAAELLAGTAAR